MVQSVSTSLELLKENSPVLPRWALEDAFLKASSYTLDTAPGGYLSALGPIDLFVVGDELRGTLLGHDFRLDRWSNQYIIDSDHETIDELILTINVGKINIAGRPVSFQSGIRLREDLAELCGTKDFLYATQKTLQLTKFFKRCQTCLTLKSMFFP